MSYKVELRMAFSVELLARVRGRGIGRLIGALFAGLSEGEPWAIAVTVVLVVLIGFWIWSKFSGGD